MSKQNTSSISPAHLAHRLWDVIFKSIAEHMPEQFIPLFNHVFDKEYPKDAAVELLSTEYSVPDKTAPRKLSSVFSDTVFRIAQTDICHIEYQMKKDILIPVRMVEYDTHIAILYGLSNPEQNASLSIQFPYSLILHLDTNHTVPDQCICHIHLSNGSTAFYSIPVVKIQDYSLQDIKKYHLTLFLPFVLLRFRPRLRAKRNKLTQKELTLFVNEIILILNTELRQKYITQREYKDYINYIRMAADQIFAHHPAFHKEVSDMLATFIPSYSEMEDKITARVTRRVTAEVTAEVTDRVTAEVTDRVTAEVTDRVTAEVTDRVTAQVTKDVTSKVTQEVTDQFQNKLQIETDKLNLKIQEKDAENARLRSILTAHGINIDEYPDEIG